MSWLNIFNKKDCYLCYLEHEHYKIVCYGPRDDFMMVDKYATFIPTIYNKSSMLLSINKLIPYFIQQKYLKYQIMKRFKVLEVKSDNK
ncbi:hypothetical protein Hokovirus_1_32 [Hokovirus HKV1]|uniref:Uncharacterized protein n=1 Tax=Hokovirus HKV1 TaxID=1977638 RepID=A0A1V0SEL1_9VIRU|nr:hypothetical protein Hokovirus_1_32 [Hokovirus HKV1]